MTSKRNQAHFRGCLLGGAIGDALGGPVEFMSLDRITDKYGKEGLTDLILNEDGKAEITDDTQMTLFTAEGILRAVTRKQDRGICRVPAVVYRAYQRWLHTQGYPRNSEWEHTYDGWLIKVKELHQRRAPGNTCISVLREGKQGSIENPVNHSKGCGGVMRVAPVGLVVFPGQAFRRGMEMAALTHGHPSGYLSAGALAYMIALIIEGQEIETALAEALAELEKHKGHRECFSILQKAAELSRSSLTPPEAIARLGEGWVGEEALAIAAYCSLKFRNNYREALIAAVNHNGDSDSTGAITGNILGAYLGVEAIPQEWLERIELAEVITKVADDLCLVYREGRQWWDQYPGY